MSTKYDIVFYILFVGFILFDILLQTQSRVVYFGGVITANIAKMPRLVLNSGYISFALGIAQNKAKTIAVFRQPFSLRLVCKGTVGGAHIMHI